MESEVEKWRVQVRGKWRVRGNVENEEEKWRVKVREKWRVTKKSGE